MKFDVIKNDMINETAYIGKHASGLKVLVMPKAGYQKTYALFATNYGSTINKFSVDGKEAVIVPDGIAHFLEHKLFEQQGDVSVFDEYAKFGASANAFTSFDLTAYLFSCTDYFEENLKILLGFVQEPYFTDENVSKEQGIIGQEIGMYDDDPTWRTTMNFLKAMYHHYPLNVDIAGTVDSISEITKETLYQCYNAFYNPSNMILIVVGNIEPTLVSDIVSEHIKPVPLVNVFPVFEAEPNSVAQNKIVQKLSVSIPQFMIGFKDSDVGYGGQALLKKDIEMSILLDMFIGKSTPLYRELYEQGLINETFYTDYENHIAYGHSVFAGESKDPYGLFEIISQRAASYTPQKEDFDRIKKVIWGDEVSQYNSIERTGNKILYNMFKEINPFDFFEVYDKITFCDIVNRFKAHFDLSKMVLSVVENLS